MKGSQFSDVPSIWKDPNVIAAFGEGRASNDICVLNCPACGELSYYNQGSSFTCRVCERGFWILGENEEVPDGSLASDYFRPDFLLTMEDVAEAECSGYLWASVSPPHRSAGSKD